MRERRINIVSAEALKEADALCFTSNGVVKSNGELVMGAGVARAFKIRFPGVAASAGERVRASGNVCQMVDNWLVEPDIRSGFFMPLVAFPTKHHWRSKSSMNLILKSAHELMSWVDEHKLSNVYLPRPGVGLGGLQWERVKQQLESVFDDRIVICHL